MQHISDEAEQRLGETGQTVVYIFPDGDAMPERNSQKATTRIDRLLADKPAGSETNLTDPESLIDALLLDGLLTEAQVQVGRFDQQITGMSIVEALLARNWLSLDLLQHRERSFRLN
jgi:hypothetical protein